MQSPNAMGIARSRYAIDVSEKTNLNIINKHLSGVNLLNQEAKTDTIKSIPDISCSFSFISPLFLLMT